jgi:hypothetical protein
MNVTALNVLSEGFLLAKEADGVADTTLEKYRVMFKSLDALPEDRRQDATLVTQQDLQALVLSLSHDARTTQDQRIAKAKSFFK